MRLANKQINILDNLDFFAKQVVEGFLVGIHKSPYHGFSVEFAEHRIYNPGDSVKNIDWKLFARSDKLFVKKFEEETNLNCHVLIDTSSSMLYPEKNISEKSFNKFTFSIYSAACLMYLFHKQRDGFGLTFFSDKIDSFIPSKLSKSHYSRILSDLHKALVNHNLKEFKKTNLANVVTSLIDQISKRSLIIIFSDMIDPDDTDNLFESLNHLKYKKNEVVLFHIKDASTEEFFNFPSKPHQFIDLETNSKIKLNPKQYQQTYLNIYNAFQEKLKLKCHQYSIDYVSCDIEDGFSKILTNYLQKRSRLF
tara:strand:- start:11 stop:934 length:924 start_codon:yes stop_codon:yes gene_type:complete